MLAESGRNATSLSALGDHVCAIEGGAVRCWGGNDAGQLGNDSTVGSSTPVNVMGITDATDVAAGWRATCAIRTGGAVSCWGHGLGGVLGNDDPLTLQSTVPVDVVSLTNVVAIAGGETSFAATRADGVVLGWGLNWWLLADASKLAWEPVDVLPFP